MSAEPWLVAENNRIVCDLDVRQLASELGVRLAYLRGTGVSSQPTRSDVLAAGARLDAERARRQAAARPRVARTPEAPLPAFTASGLDPSTCAACRRRCARRWLLLPPRLPPTGR